MRVLGDMLTIDGTGRAAATLDRKPVQGETRVPLTREHRLEIGRGIYRIVRRGTTIAGEVL